ncbi:MAG TPA: ferritin-like domain-containing protein [Polyangiaceae bacterium]|nr:ferritin-like domain-containing protein [Polyangiaceae bacterium]
MKLHALELRRAVLASLGLGVACASPAAGPSADGDIVIPTPGSASPDATRPTAERPTPATHGYANGPLGWHRGGPDQCDAAISTPSCRGDEGHKDCTADADCTEHAHGKCITGMGQIGSYCACRYSCETDSDCSTYAGGEDEHSPQVCVCKPALGAGAESSICAPASCRSDTECESGTCGVSRYHNGCYTKTELACRTADDTCKTAEDCQGGGQCAVRKDKWTCQGRTCVIGRPLLIDGHAARAELRGRRDWLSGDGAPPDPGPFVSTPTAAPPAAHADAAAFWAEAARLEHASVASFARFSLQLLALGAPAELIRDTHAAALDEIEHAKLAFAVAASLSGEAFGPGPLVEATSPISTDLADIVRALVVEGCVGETMGALEARAQLEAARGLARVALDRIAPDEARHAELAWRSLAWMVATFGARVVPVARAAFDDCARDLATLGVSSQAGAVEHGVLGAGEAAAARRLAWSEVVLPACRALVG